MTAEAFEKTVVESISIHILHTKDDLDSANLQDVVKFQSTSFIRRMTSTSQAMRIYSTISIHILHTKDDTFAKSQ